VFVLLSLFGASARSAGTSDAQLHSPYKPVKNIELSIEWNSNLLVLFLFAVYLIHLQKQSSIIL